MPEKTHTIRGLLGILWDFAMWRGDVPTQRNPDGTGHHQRRDQTHEQAAQSHRGRVPTVHRSPWGTIPHDGFAVRLVSDFASAKL
jgi:hypothetical protein